MKAIERLLIQQRDLIAGAAKGIASARQDPTRNAAAVEQGIDDRSRQARGALIGEIDEVKTDGLAEERPLDAEEFIFGSIIAGIVAHLGERRTLEEFPQFSRLGLRRAIGRNLA